MQILFLTENFYPNGSGGELATFLYANILSRAGFKVVVVTNRFSLLDPPFTKNGNLIIFRLQLFGNSTPSKFSILARSGILLSTGLRKLIENSDAIYIPGFWYPAIILAKSFKKPVITHLHGYSPICPLATNYPLNKAFSTNCNFTCCSKCISAYEISLGRDFFPYLGSLIFNSLIGNSYNRIAEMSDALICVSEAQKKIFVKKNPSFASKLHVIYNPLPNIPFNNEIGSDIGYFGGSSSLKGFDTLLKSMAFLRNELKDTTIKVHATNLNFSESQRQLIERFGFVPYQRLQMLDYEKLQTKLKGVVIPSAWQEPFGYVAIEALLRGKLVIAAEIGGLPEVLKDCPGSWFFPSNDFKKLAQMLLIIKNLSEEESTNLCLQNRTVIMEKFSNEKILKKFITILEKVIYHYSS